MLVHRVNKLRATDSSISPGLINKVHSIYISVPWFRFTLMDLSFRVLFHRFQIIFDRIRRTFSVAIGTKSTNAIKYSPGITAVLGDRSHERIQLFQFTLSDQSFKLTRQDRMVLWVEVEGCCTCRILMRCNVFEGFCFLSFFLFSTRESKLFKPQ